MTLIIQKPTGSKLNLAKEFTAQDYMWNFPQQYGLWSPAEITTALWLDAADASTIAESGGAVSQWDDKSGNNRHASQGTAAAQPALTLNGLNGKAVLTFNGSTNTMAVNYNYTGNAATLYAVAARLPGGSEEQWIFSSYGGSNGTPLIAPMWIKGTLQGGQTEQWASYGGNQATFALGGVNIPTNGQGFILGIDSSITDSVLDMYTNGARTAQHPGAVRFDGGGARNFLGAELNGANRFLSGYIAEIVQVEARLSTANRQKLEGYLAHKWGLTANLPSDHPYKLVGPTP